MYKYGKKNIQIKTALFKIVEMVNLWRGLSKARIGIVEDNPLQTKIAKNIIHIVSIRITYLQLINLQLL